MRQDICFYFETDVKTLYNAYLRAASEKPFERSCKKEPYHTLTFGLNFSMKYNMNGGSCILHFIPYDRGAAVDMRFVLAQSAGARCGKYADYLTSFAEKILEKKAASVNLPIDLFIAPENKVDAAITADPPAPPTKNKPQNSCISCGHILPDGSNFCPKCGTKQQQTQNKFCVYCGAKINAADMFCYNCGKKV